MLIKNIRSAFVKRQKSGNIRNKPLTLELLKDISNKLNKLIPRSCAIIHTYKGLKPQVTHLKTSSNTRYINENLSFNYNAFR